MKENMELERKPNARQSVGGYAKYIATREGVDNYNDILIS